MDPQFSNNILATKYGFSNLGFFIFIQRWIELFDHKTIDSYQFHVLNSHWLIKETLDTIGLIRSGTVVYANLPPLLTETRDVIINDICLQKNAQPLRGRLIDDLAKPPKADDKAGIIRLEYQLRHALSYIAPKYLEWLIADLKEAIDNDETERTNILTGELATELVNLGWSPRSLSRLVKYVCFRSHTASFSHMWRGFIQEIRAPIQRFVCYYLCKGNNISLLIDADISIKDGVDIIAEYPNLYTNISETSKYIAVESSARAQDIHSAVQDSKQYISKIQAIINYNETDITIDRSIVVIFPGGQKSQVYNIDDTTWKSTSRLDHPYFVTIDGLNKVLTNPDIDESGKAKLMNLLKQYNVSLEALSPETWFTNLWIALESFVVSGQHSSIIEHVRTLVPSVLCNTYVYHILKNFLTDCEKCGVKPICQGANISTERPNLSEVTRLMNLLRTPTESETLIGMCSGYSLLELRCKELTRAMNSNKTVSNLIQSHYNRLSWHLQRLYRVRNSLVHSSESRADLLQLTVHLNHYLRSLVAQVVYRFGSGNYKSLGELFIAFEENYLATEEVLNCKEPYENDLVLKGPLF